MPNFEEDILKSVEEINKRHPLGAQSAPSGNGSAEPAKPPYDFDQLAAGLVDGLVEAASQQVTLATNFLEKSKALAENIRAQVAEQNAELVDLNTRLTAFGKTVLDAHRQFHEARVNAAAEKFKSPDRTLP